MMSYLLVIVPINKNMFFVMMLDTNRKQAHVAV